MSETAAEQRELRAKYLDWCSARLAERFLALSPDEIYELAERTSHGRTESLVAFSASVPTSSSAFELNPENANSIANPYDSDSFRVLVARVTEVLADTLELPDFEAWAALYREAPQRFDEELVGFWRDAV
jgi:hypothetical protein